MRRRHAILVLPAVIAVAGCGRSDGVVRYAISGTVTYDGKPLAAGGIRFTPDSDQGNRGPASNIEVMNGRYQSIKGYGVVGGAYTVEIRRGVEYPAPEPPPHTVKVELPKKDSVMDFDVPRK